jgi:hypothetical protein
MRTSDSFFCLNQSVNFKDVAPAKREFFQFALFQHRIKVSNTCDMAQAIQNSQVCGQVNVLQAAAKFVGQFQRQLVGRQAVSWMKIFEGAFDAPQVFRRESRADVHIFRDQRDTVMTRCQSADEAELNFRVV